MVKISQKSLLISDIFDDNTIGINLDFPLNYNSKEIVAFEKYVVANKQSDLKVHINKVTSKKKESYDQELESLK